MKKKVKRKRASKLSQYELDAWLFQIFSYLLDGSCQVFCRRKVIEDGIECWALWHGGENIKRDKIFISIGTRINYRLQFFNKLIHECLHGITYISDKKFGLNEKAVRKLAYQICRQMSPIQYARLIIALGKNLERHYQPRRIRKIN